MAEPTEFHRAFRDARKEKAKISQKEMAGKLGVTEEFYQRVENNKPHCYHAPYAERIINLIVPGDEKDPAVSKTRNKLRAKKGYDADIEEILDLVIGIKRPERPAFGVLSRHVRLDKSLERRTTLFNRTKLPKNALDAMENYPDHFNSFVDCLVVIEKGYGIKRQAGDKIGFSAIQEFFSQAMKAKKVRDVFLPEFGQAAFSHRMVQGYTTQGPKMLGTLTLDKLVTLLKRAKIGNINNTVISEIENGIGDYSLDTFRKLVLLYNGLRARKITLPGQPPIEMAPITERELDLAREGLVNKGIVIVGKIDPNNLSFEEFVEVGLVLTERDTSLRKAGTNFDKEAVEFAQDLRDINEFLGVGNINLAGTRTLNPSVIMARRSPLPIDDQKIIFAGLDIKDIAHMKELAKQARAVKKFNIDNFDKSLDLNLKELNIQKKTFYKHTGIITTKAEPRQARRVRAVTEYFTEERQAVVKELGRFAKNDEARFNEDSPITWTIVGRIYADKEAQDKMAPESGLPPEVIFYDKAAKADPEGLGQKWTAEVRGTFLTAYNYRDRFHAAHPELSYGASRA